MSDQLFYLFSAVLLGLVIGALIMYFSSAGDKNSKDTIDELEKKLNQYQNDVAEHFEETANLVDDMTQSYKKVFDHMGKSARLLMTEEQIAEQIEKRKGNKVTLEFLTDDSDQDVEKVGTIVDDELEKVEPLKKEEIETVEVSEDVDKENEFTDDIEEIDGDELSAKEDTLVEEVKPTKEEELIDLEHEVEIREKNIYS
jgi:uncharacterized membrane-anchored protein YhcB (DUF1043 family)